jgi:hypothetical protein
VSVKFPSMMAAKDKVSCAHPLTKGESGLELICALWSLGK